MNLARLCTSEHDFAQTEALLQKAASLQPLNVEGLVLLANAELMLGHFAQALGYAREVLSHPLPNHASQTAVSRAGAPAPNAPAEALAHLIAGKALEAQQHPAAAASEYRIILQEYAQTSAVENARQALAGLPESVAANNNGSNKTQ